jgi:dihydrofolate synthase/folylpolyglutamate synthase
MSIEAKIAKIMANDTQVCKLNDLLFILDRFNFHKKFKIITIAGTNGKGTTVAMLEELLAANNRNVLSHISPHIFSFNERISLNKKPISDSLLLALLERLEEITIDYKLSYYQIAFLCTCIYSQKIDIDYLIMEVGIGGRLDAVNILDHDITAITNIDFDHCEILGDTLDKIGLEKAGISRNGIPLFLGSKMPDSVYDYASAVQAKVHEKSYIVSLKDCFTDSFNIAQGIADYLFLKQEINYIPRLEHIRANARIVSLKSDAKKKSYIVVDVAHNPASVKYLFKILNDKFSAINVEYEAVFGILGSKDLANVLSIAKKYISRWNVIDLSYIDLRAQKLDNIKKEFNLQSITRVDYHKNLTSVYLSKKSNVTVVFGSFVLAGAFIKEYEKSSN